MRLQCNFLCRWVNQLISTSLSAKCPYTDVKLIFQRTIILSLTMIVTLHYPNIWIHFSWSIDCYLFQRSDKRVMTCSIIFQTDWRIHSTHRPPRALSQRLFSRVPPGEFWSPCAAHCAGTERQPVTNPSKIHTQARFTEEAWSWGKYLSGMGRKTFSRHSCFNVNEAKKLSWNVM